MAEFDFGPTRPSDMNFTMRITMPLHYWLDLKGQLSGKGGSVPASWFIDKINSMVNQAEKHHREYAEPEDQDKEIEHA